MDFAHMPKTNVYNLILLFTLAAGQCVVAQSSANLDWASILTQADHLDDLPALLVTPKTPEGLKKTQDILKHQILAIEYIRDNKIKSAIPNLITYLNYALEPGAGDPAHGPDLANVKKNYIAFGALVDMPESARLLNEYCLNPKNPLGYRLAALHTLKYIDNNLFEKACIPFENDRSNPKIIAYVKYLHSPHAQFMGIPDVK
jgi:hypothetical protein